MPAQFGFRNHINRVFEDWVKTTGRNRPMPICVDGDDVLLVYVASDFLLCGKDVNGSHKSIMYRIDQIRKVEFG